MISGHTAPELAVLIGVCVLSIFLFPAMQGPYPAVHGPVTALQAARAATRLRWAIVQAAMKTFQNSIPPPFVKLFCTKRGAAEFGPVGLAEGVTILRC
jgi:hypothetical protein